jgi:hypothetical protein
LGIAVVAIVCLAVAAVLTWVVVPGRAKLPAHEQATRHYEGTATTLLNPAALDSGDSTKVLLQNVPVVADRTVKVSATDGDAAEVHDTRVVRTANGQALGRTESTYAVDRKSLDAAGSHPASWKVLNQHGLTINWPVGAGKKNYVGWVGDTQSTTPLTYIRAERHRGIDAYVYNLRATAAPIKDPQVLAALPQSISPTKLGGLVSALPIPGMLKAQFAQALPQLTGDVPLTYTYEATSTFWVEPTTGIVVDSSQHEIRKVGMLLPGGQSVPPAFTVYDATLTDTAGSVREAANDATHNRNSIRLYGVTLPLILLVFGLLGLLATTVLFIRGRRPATIQQPEMVSAGYRH